MRKMTERVAMRPAPTRLVRFGPARRAFALILAFVLVITGLSLVLPAPQASAAPLDVHVGSNVVNGKMVITRRIEVPFTTIERWEDNVIADGSMAGFHHCQQVVIRKLDTEFLSGLTNSAWAGYPNGAYVPSKIGVFAPLAPDSYATRNVVDLAELSQTADYDYGTGLGIVASSYATTLRDGCSHIRQPVGNYVVPIVGMDAWDTAVEVDITAVGGSTGRYSFKARAEHPVVADVDFTYEWVFEGGPSANGSTEAGADVVGNFTATDPTSRNFRHWELSVRDDNGHEIAFREGWLQSLDVSLTRPDTDPVHVGDTFSVTLTVSAPADNPGRLTAVTPVTTDIVLPDWIELVDGDLPGDFILEPGASQTATFTLRATVVETGELVATWRAQDAAGGTVEGIGVLSVKSVGTFGGEWFRTDNLGDSVRQGDTAPIRLRVENETDQPLTEVVMTEVSVTEPAEEEADEGDDSGEPGEDGDDATEGVGGAKLTPQPGGLRGSLGASGIEALDFLDFTLEGVQPGEIELSATFTGKDPAGNTVTGTVVETWQVIERPLKVEVTPHLRKADGTLPELNMDNDGNGRIDLDDHRFDVDVKISNDADEPVTDLAFLDAAEPVDWSNNLVDEGQGAPKLKLLGVRGDPITGPEGEPVKGPIEELNVDIPDLAARGEAGDSYTVTFVYEATGELDADGQSVVDGKIGERGVRGSGSASVKFASGLLLEFSSWLKEPTRLTTSGQVVRMGGYLKNLDEDKKDANGNVTKKGRSIALWITPVTEGNAGGGYLVEREGGRTPLGAEFLELAPGQRMDLHGILVTRPMLVRTDAHVEYRISAWNLPEAPGDQAIPIEDERIDLVENPDEGWGPAHDQRLQFADVGKQDLKACETHLYDAIVTCNFYEGLVSLLTSVPDAAKMAKSGLEQFGQATYWVGSWAMKQLGDISAALDKDPAAQARLAAELRVQLSTWYDLSILAGDAGTAGAAALADFIHQTNTVINEGDTEAALAWVANFAGENPDLLIGGVFKARALAAMGQSALRGEVRSAAGTIVREAVETEAQLASRRLATEIDLAVAQGLDPKTPAVLKGGLDVTDTPKVWRDVYGAARDDVQKMLKIAKEEGVLIAFRSRSPISIKLLEEGLAWLKPQSVKAKTVSAIDIKYLGFPEDALGKVVMVQPPFGARLTGDALEVALDAHMSKLKVKHVELFDQVHAAEVRDRLKMRANKYHEHLAEWIDYAENGMPVGFEYSKNGVTSGRDVSELRNVKLEVSQVENPVGGEMLTRIDLKVAGANGTDFRYLTGDIDIVGFFNLDRSPIMDAAIREALYEKMRSLVGMQHGETMTWDHQKRAELLREHVGDKAETLLVASPDERLYTSVLDEKKSSAVAPGGNFGDTFTLLDGPPKELKSPARPRGPAASGILTSLADVARSNLQRPERYLLPANIVKLLTRNGQPIATSGSQSSTATPLVVRPDGSIDIYQPAAETPQPLRSRSALQAMALHATVASAMVPGSPSTLAASRRGGMLLSAPDAGLIAAKAALGDNDPFTARPAIGAAGGTWRTVSLDEALALDTPGVLNLPVQSWTDASALAGEKTLSVLTPGDLGVLPGDWFQPGDTVVVDPGGAYEQMLTVSGVDGHVLTFSVPLINRIDAAVQVLHLRATSRGGEPGTGSIPGNAADGIDNARVDGADTGHPGPSSGPPSANSGQPADVAIAGKSQSRPQTSNNAIGSADVLARTGLNVAELMRLTLLLMIAGGFALWLAEQNWQPRDRRPD